MEVHLPEKPIESWREFFVHLFTITIGLLIALGIESTAEWVHHRHLVHEARTNIHAEMIENHNQVKQDLEHLKEDETKMKANLSLLIEVRKTHVVPKGQTLSYGLSWSSFNDSAWNTARDTGALGYMAYKDVQQFADVYSQQGIVNTAAVGIFQDQIKAISPLLAYGDKGAVDKMQPEEMNLVIQRSGDVLMTLQGLEQVLSQLDDMYVKALKQMPE